ncbi:zeta toxin family protein [Streptomyces sp. NPDC038707]|uniref:zeta toxin family protein n=1 Tax=Streptomyces sp. NPDC038707 TaxID=3154329 RepID=UPI00340E8694
MIDPAEVERYRLPEAENQRIFRERIVPDLLAGRDSRETPTVVFLVGQPGAGKSRVTEMVAALLNQHGGLADIDSDLYKPYHPAYAELMARATPHGPTPEAETDTTPQPEPATTGRHTARARADVMTGVPGPARNDPHGRSRITSATLPPRDSTGTATPHCPTPGAESGMGCRAQPAGSRAVGARVRP